MVTLDRTYVKLDTHTYSRKQRLLLKTQNYFITKIINLTNPLVKIHSLFACLYCIKVQILCFPLLFRKTSTISDTLNTTSSSSSSTPYGQIKGVMSMCVSQDYLVARGNLESSSLGRFFSFLTAHTSKVSSSVAYD